MKTSLGIAVLIATALIAMPAQAADPANGKRVAQRWCASCHVVSLDQRQVGAAAPTFSAIGRRPGFDPGQTRMVPARSAPHHAQHVAHPD